MEHPQTCACTVRWVYAIDGVVGGLDGMRVALVKDNVGRKCGLVVEVAALCRLARKIRHLPEQSNSSTLGFGSGVLIVTMMFAALTC